MSENSQISIKLPEDTAIRPGMKTKTLRSHG